MACFFFLFPLRLLTFVTSFSSPSVFSPSLFLIHIVFTNSFSLFLFFYSLALTFYTLFPFPLFLPSLSLVIRSFSPNFPPPLFLILLFFIPFLNPSFFICQLLSYPSLFLTLSPLPYSLSSPFSYSFLFLILFAPLSCSPFIPLSIPSSLFVNLSSLFQLSSFNCIFLILPSLLPYFPSISFFPSSLL